MKVKYKYDEVFNSTLDYFNGDELAAKVWISKYALKDSDGNIYELNPNDMHWRLANEIARIESKYKEPLTSQELFDLFEHFKYIVPQGSPMTGIGNPFQIASLSNCFVIGLDTISDSYGGIVKIDEELVQLMKRRGGVGHDLSHIRPKGSPVKNSALTSTGLVPFMERYSNSTKEVAQDGRRGALMLSVSCKHPDSEDFIDAKLEQGKITGANVSVKITDEFMNSVLNKEDYLQTFPIDWNGANKVSDFPLDELIRVGGAFPSHKQVFFKRTNAEKIWKKIIHNAWKSAEPGVLFWDNIIKESLPDCYQDFGFKTVSTNPCQPSWANVLTPFGLKQFNQIKVGDQIWTKEGWSTIIRKQSSGIKDVYEFRTTAGSFIGTENHRIISNGEKIEAKDAENIDVLAGSNNGDNVIRFPHIIMDGLVLGNGSVHKTSNNLIYLCIDKNNYNYFNSEIKNFIGLNRKDIEPYAYEVKTNLRYNDLPLPFEREIPYNYMYNANHDMVCSFLRGLFSANASVFGKRVTFTTTSPILRDQIQILLSSVGIRSYYTTNKSNKCLFENGEFMIKESYDINISTDSKIFSEKIGFIQKYKNEKLLEYIDDIKLGDKNHNIISKTYISTEEVFNITVDNSTHTYWTNGLNVSNCGEIPLCPYDSCRLIAINLYSYVVNPFTDKAYFDYNLFSKHVRLAQRIMDDIIDLEVEKIDKILEKIDSDPESDIVKRNERELWENIKKMAILGRRTGVGITAEGDMIAAMNLRYGTKEATDFAVEVHKQLAISAYTESIYLAKERGAFSVWNKDLEAKNPFLQRILKELSSDVIKMYEQYGRRNIACLTIAPTGTTSMMTQSTSGIEPVFLPVYKRRRKINPNDKETKVDFIDENGDSWEEYVVFHHKFVTWMESKGISTTKKYSNEEIDAMVAQSPYFKATSNDVDWAEKVRMQGKIQKWVDHSISVTINLPKDASEELVNELYILAWKSGCKGCTVYRDGSRAGVLISNNEPKNENKRGIGFKRPKVLEAKIVHFQNSKEKWVAVVGIIDGEPYEIFTGINDEEDGIMIPKSITEGKVIKFKDPETDERRYDLEYVNKRGVKVTVEGLNFKFNPEYWNYAKLISGVLRYGMPIDQVVKLVKGLELNDTINTWKNGVERAFKGFLPDGDIEDNVCPTCGQKSLIREEGCIRCTSCEFSRCGG